MIFKYFSFFFFEGGPMATESDRAELSRQFAGKLQEIQGSPLFGRYWEAVLKGKMARTSNIHITLRSNLYEVALPTGIAAFAANGLVVVNYKAGTIAPIALEVVADALAEAMLTQDGREPSAFFREMQAQLLGALDLTQTAACVDQMPALV
jgi:hypothetical protein